MKVFVYWNLHKKLWSIRCEEKGHPMRGRVVAHREDLMLSDVMPKVSQAGRARVLREHRKNVHAGLVGQWDDNATQFYGDGYTVTYNPYREGRFVYTVDRDVAYDGSAVAQLNGRRVSVLGIN